MRASPWLVVLVLAGCTPVVASTGETTPRSTPAPSRASAEPGWRAIGGTGLQVHGLDDMVVAPGALPALVHEATGARLIAIEMEEGFSSAFVDGMLDGMTGWTPVSREDTTIDGRRATVVRGGDGRAEGLVVVLGTASRVIAVHAGWPLGVDGRRIERALLSLRWSETPVAANQVSPVVLGPAREGLWEALPVTGGMPAYRMRAADVILMALALDADEPQALVADTCRGAPPDVPALTTLQVDSARRVVIGGLEGCELVGHYVATSGEPKLGYRLVLAFPTRLALISAAAPLADGSRWLDAIRELAATARPR